MSETTFTTPPWKAWKGAPDEPNRWLVVADGAEHPYLIATIENGQPGDCLETEGHTAHLIAAAPDLLAALETANARFADIEEFRGSVLERRISDAMRKARGEA